MKKLLKLLIVSPIMITACGETTTQKIELTNYDGYLKFDINTKDIEETTYDSDNWKYSQSLEMRNLDRITFPNAASATKSNFEEKYSGMTSDALNYCPAGIAPEWGNILNDDLSNKAYLASIDKRKINKSIVNLIGDDVESIILNYTNYLNSIDEIYKDMILECYDIGEEKTYSNIESWVKTGGWGGSNQSYFPILKSANMFKFDIDNENITLNILGGNNEGYSSADSFIISYEDSNGDVKHITPNLGINLDKGTDYLRTNWLNAQLNIIGRY